METYQKELSEIKTILKNNPKGMTVTDIAHAIKINRNSVAKYLDVLLISGHAEMVTFGPAKVFFPSTRIPLSALLNFTHDYIALLNKDLQFLQVNDNFLKILDIQRDDIIGHSIDTFTNLFFRIPEIAQNSHHALNGRELTIEKRYTDKNQTYYLNIKHLPTTFDDGEPGVTLIIEDTTDRKQAEEKMRCAIQEWETTFNAVSDMVFIQNNEFTVVRANRAFADFLHMTPDECVGKKCYHLLHGSEELHASCPCVQAQLTKKPVTVEFFEPHLDKYLKISASPIFNEDGDLTSSVHTMRDITEQKKKEM